MQLIGILPMAVVASVSHIVDDDDGDDNDDDVDDDDQTCQWL